MSDWLIVTIGSFVILPILVKSGIWLYRSSARSGEFSDHNGRTMQNVWDAAHMGDADGHGDGGGSH